ncbi:hypothetical protein C450_05290 [Halococcus salifodinae DSM 8989]|uniref:Uncharacterized protein n=1 Tax=Halococcus salifodinae DSM 8989 TaxID=1227456 RepID=M0N9Q0_9EURY|nr:hypothetical protein C450_05290 [Halococcus salifodinae DSM 8989]
MKFRTCNILALGQLGAVKLFSGHVEQVNGHISMGAGIEVL